METNTSSNKLIKLLVLCFLLLFGFNVLRISTFNISSEKFQSFSIIFVSLLLDSLPFILLGSLVSSIIHIFVSEELISKILPKNKFLCVLVASLSGFVFPICECAIVPIAHKLIKKGVPLSAAVTFMLSVPIVNPVVLFATYYAFSDFPKMVAIRALFGMVSAIVIGLLMEYLEGTNSVIKDVEYEDCCSHIEHKDKKMTKKETLFEILEHTCSEFYNIGKLLLIGALISAAVQTVLPQDIIINLGVNNSTSILVMMGMAYLLSLCSEADAFIGRSFYSNFSIGAVSSFLIMGPMIDIKNTIMLGSMFKKKFVIELILLIIFMAFVCGSLINNMGL